MNDFALYSALGGILMGAVMLLLPHYSARRYFFAITVSPEYRASAEARRSLRRYQLWVGASVLASAGLGWLGVPPLLPFLVGFTAFLYERRATRRHAATLPPEREADLTADGDELPRWMPLAILPFGFPLAAALYLKAHWSEIPDQFPTHWDINGQPDQWTVKSALGVYGTLLFSSAMMFFLLGLSVAMFYGARRSAVRISMLKMMVTVIYVMSGVFSAVALMPVMAVPGWMFFVPAPAFTVALLVWSYRVVRRQPGEATPDEKWHLGAIYYNPQDAAVFVQKRFGFGYTFNFGNPLTWVIVGCMIAMFAAMTLLLPH